MDLAQGHVVALAALEKDETFKPSAASAGTGFGGSGGKYKAFNLGKGRGMSGKPALPSFVALWMHDSGASNMSK
jgi:UDP-glucose 4-epimerase